MRLITGTHPRNQGMRNLFHGERVNRIGDRVTHDGDCLGFVCCYASLRRSFLDGLRLVGGNLLLAGKRDDCVKVDSRELNAAAQRVVDEASRQSRVVVHDLRQRGLSVREIGVMLGITPSRVSQLGKDKATA